MQCFRSEGVKVVKVVWGIWGLNMFCRVLSRLHNILISFQTPKLSSLSSQVHKFANLFYKMMIFTNFLLTFSNLYLTSSELVNLVKNRGGLSGGKHGCCDGENRKTNKAGHHIFGNQIHL